MKVKSFYANPTDGGIEGAIKVLDDKVNKIGNIKIHSCTDTLYPKITIYREPRLVRVIIYEE